MAEVETLADVFGDELGVEQPEGQLGAVSDAAEAFARNAGEVISEMNPVQLGPT